MAKQRKKINKPKVRKPKPPAKQKSGVVQVVGKQKAQKDKKPTYEPYTGPVVDARTYSLFKSPLERANAKRREEAHRRGEKMYKARVRIPASDTVPEHHVWVDKLVQDPKKEETKENKHNGSNKSVATEQVSGVQVGPESVEAGAEAGS